MSNNKQQTAVEWLAIYLKEVTTLNCDDIIKQAKEMEKEQIVDAVDSWIHTGNIKGEQYYNETFGGNNEQRK
jgi:hypothetical protein